MNNSKNSTKNNSTKNKNTSERRPERREEPRWERVERSYKMKVVYVITEREGRSFWNRVGVAFVNSDGSLNVKLEALPVSGELHIRDYTPPSDERSEDDDTPF